ncbi:MAG: trehalose-phosphatase [Nannocystaceae bacterium]|nr:trehalose-phosphatase [Nannocystaceae bacterium]
MRHLLAKTRRPLLAALARQRVLLAFDYDGTLAALVESPARSAMRPRTARLLQQVARRYPVAIISGRAAEDVRARLGGAVVRAVIGNHGAELGAHPQQTLARIARWREVLAAALADEPGVVIEDKRYSLAVHYRRSSRRAHARARIVAHARGLEAMRVVEGKAVVNLVPRDAPDKGGAIAWALAQLQCDAVIYVGDDITDEDAFRYDGGVPLLGVRVGADPTSAARWFLRSQRAIDRLLRLLLVCRT